MPVFNAYIDGFNLYMGALKGRPELKWLDLVAFCEAARPEMQLGKIYFFTAAISEKYPGDDAPRRQEKYLRVLTHQGVIVVRGKFRKDQRWKTVVTMSRTSILKPILPRLLGLTQLALWHTAKKAEPATPKAWVYDVEEKGSDVNLASFLLRDVFTRNLEAALVVSGDSDLVTPVKFAIEAGVDLHVLVPNKRQNTSNLRSVCKSVRQLHASELVSMQLPKTFLGPKGRQVVRPKEWA